MINIAFITEIENAKVSGIELIPQGTIGALPARPSAAWSNGSVQSPVARYEPISVQVGTKLFVMGGFTSFDLGVINRVDIYDFATKTWSVGSPLPGAQTHAAAVSDGTYIYVAGGQLGGGEASGSGTNEVWRYDIANDLWTPFTPLPDVRFGGTMKIIDNVLHYVGGDLADRSTISTLHWAFDLNGGTGWTTLAPIPIGGDHLGSAVVNGIWYTVGGEHDHGTLYTQHSYVFAYDPSTDTWARKADIPIARSHIEGGTFVINGNIYVMGGQTDHLGMTADVEEYDPINDVWWKLAALPGVRKGVAGAFYNGQIFLIAGQSYYHVESGSYVGTISNA
jgi:N-acetylneuraminic acid mutarotase